MSIGVVRRAEPGSAELPIYEGIPLSRISLVVSDELAGQARTALMAADAIGFDTESKPTFLKGAVSTGPIWCNSPPMSMPTCSRSPGCRASRS